MGGETTTKTTQKMPSTGISQLDGAASALESEEDNDDYSCEVSKEEVKINMNNMNNYSCPRFLLTNARSLTPKIDTMINAFSSLNLHFACITKT